MFRQSPASSDYNDSQAPAPGNGFSDPDTMQGPSPTQSTFANSQALHSTNQIQEPARHLSLVHHSFPVDQQPPNSGDVSGFDPSISGGSLRSSLASPYVVSDPFISSVICALY